MRRGRLIALLSVGVGCLLLAGWLALPGARHADGVSASEPAAAPVASTPSPRAEAPVPPGLRLRATLAGDHPFRGEARLGVAFVSEADRLTWERARREGERAGPSRLEELANVSTWSPVVVTPTASGGELGPVDVPSAPRYRVLAWEEDGTSWTGDWMSGAPPRSGGVDLGVLRATPPTGVRVRLLSTHADAGPFSLRVTRGVDAQPAEAERASAWLTLVRLAAPALASALRDGSPLPVSLGQDTVLAPLPPDRLVRIWLRARSGQEAGPVEVPLREGRIEPVTLDADRLFPGGMAGTVTLHGRVTLGDASRAPPGAVVELPGGHALTVEPDGRFLAPELPAWRPTRFTLRVPEPSRGRPVAPARWAFTFTPTAGHTEAEEAWRVPAYRWLLLQLDGFTRGQLAARAQAPFPVYALQRRDDAGAWRDVAAEAFLPEPEGLAVSLTSPGTYRVLIATSSVSVTPSPAVSLNAADLEGAVSPRLGDEGVPCEVVVTEGGRPVYGAEVTAAGEVASLPPLRGHTDAEGRWRLGRVKGSALHVEVGASGHASWEREAAAECLRSGRIEVRW
ncbi:carboxypeptidase regulatory-like domain-containing protein [Corallococcus sp. H22C18031201]|nr:carboxypeptidase regulatory-like domain-containing protein [Corallococcus sp. H22C18031201]